MEGLFSTGPTPSSFLTQHQSTSAEWPTNTRPDCGRRTPKVPGVFGQNQSVIQKSGNDCWNQKKIMIENFTDRFQFPTRLQLKSQSIEVVKQMKILGTTFTDRLSWSENSDSILKKLNARMQLIRKIWSFCSNYQEMVHLWKTFCLSILEQSCAMLGGMITAKNKKDCERTQQNFAKLVI